MGRHRGSTPPCEDNDSDEEDDVANEERVRLGCRDESSREAEVRRVARAVRSQVLLPRGPARRGYRGGRRVQSRLASVAVYYSRLFGRPLGQLLRRLPDACSRGRRIGHPLRGNLVPLIGVGVAFGNVLRQHGFFCKYWFISINISLAI